MISTPWSLRATRLGAAALLAALSPVSGARAEPGPPSPPRARSFATLTHASVAGGALDTLTVAGGPEARPPSAARFADLAGTPRKPGRYRLAFEVPAGARAVEVPPCAGRGAVRLDGAEVADAGAGAFEGKAPRVVPLAGPGPHALVLEVDVGPYEKRIACGYAPRAGETRSTPAGLSVLSFASPETARGGGRAVVYVPTSVTRSGADAGPMPLLVGPHPWNGGPWTYAAYEELLSEADARGVVLLFPSGLGNSLYTADAEREVVRAVDEAVRGLPIDEARVSIWGASMGGAGATTIAFHRPSRFASVSSFFGDAKYDLGTYVRPILRDARGEHAVSALDVVDSARHLDVLLVHGEDDRVSSPKQSTMLADALRARGFTVRLELVKGMGHEGSLVARFAREVVRRAEAARIPVAPTRVSFVSARPEDTEAYGVRIERASDGKDARVDIEAAEATPGRVRVHALSGVRSVTLAGGALGLACDDGLRDALAGLSRARRGPDAVVFRCEGGARGEAR